MKDKIISYVLFSMFILVGVGSVILSLVFVSVDDELFWLLSCFCSILTFAFFCFCLAFGCLPKKENKND